jgi:hypothetical protein
MLSEERLEKEEILSELARTERDWLLGAWTTEVQCVLELSK